MRCKNVLTQGLLRAAYMFYFFFPLWLLEGDEDENLRNGILLFERS
jgi:hypothetical protein